MKDTTFYNSESGIYSAKRYPDTPVTFTQYFFIKRLSITLNLLAKEITKNNMALLEIGTADGVVVQKVLHTFPNTFSRVDAVDASSDMIEVARARHAGLPANFSVRTTLAKGVYDVVLETGVINYTDYKAEMVEVAGVLTPTGLYLLTIAGNSSLQNVVKGGEGYNNLETYAVYEKELLKYFTIMRAVPVGFFVPFLWRVPAIARVLQPMVEVLLYPFKSLALEKVYVLKLK